MLSTAVYPAENKRIVRGGCVQQHSRTRVFASPDVCTTVRSASHRQNVLELHALYTPLRHIHIRLLLSAREVSVIGYPPTLGVGTSSQ